MTTKLSPETTRDYNKLVNGVYVAPRDEKKYREGFDRIKWEKGSKTAE